MQILSKSILFLLICLFSFSLNGFAHQTHTVKTIPNPKSPNKSNFISNPDGIVNTETVQEINELCLSIEKNTTAQYVVAIVYNYDGEDDFEFAMDIFEEWGIGEKDKDNGLLLFISVDKHQYRFISGYGMEGVLPDLLLKRIGEKYLVPNFKRENYGQGILEVTQVIYEILTDPIAAEEIRSNLFPENRPIKWGYLGQKIGITLLLFSVIMFFFTYSGGLVLPKKVSKDNAETAIFSSLILFGILFIIAWALQSEFYESKSIFRSESPINFTISFALFALYIKFNSDRSEIRKTFTDALDYNKAIKKYTLVNLLAFVLVPVTWIGLMRLTSNLVANRNRFTPPDDSGNWERIKRTGDSSRFLSSGQQTEENVKKFTYEIWKNNATGEIKSIPWKGMFSRKYSECSNCHFKTVSLEKKTLIAASYTAKGKGEKILSCAHCKHEISKGFFTIPKLYESSSTGSSYSSGGSGRSYGGGSSFGGGSSGGGGAGGSW